MLNTLGLKIYHFGALSSFLSNQTIKQMEVSRPKKIDLWSGYLRDLILMPFKI
jgi:hypothetical protein